MLIRIDPDDARPIYRQVADEIRTLIAAGKLREGAALPPVRQVAADLGVNLNTIATAYRELQDEGLISIRHGSGAVVNERTPSRADKQAAARELRTPLRTALAQLVLAGLPANEILNIVAAELRGLTKGAR
ncbi:MAG: GntR family transcriptional regulator [Acidobacteria bacterium]|nr:GntR family transcriptional regulator [Acidobacteriota bacterium]